MAGALMQHAPGADVLAKDCSIGLVCVHDQDMQTPQRVTCPRDAPCVRGAGSQTHGKPEGGADTWSTLHPNVSTHPLHQFSGNSQPQACAAILAGCRTINLRENGEEP